MRRVMEQSSDLGGNVGKGGNPGEHAEFGTNAGHAVDGAGCLILTDGDAAGVKNSGHSLSAVAAYAAHDDSNGAIAVEIGDRLHEFVDGRHVQSIATARVECDSGLVIGQALHDPHVSARRGNVSRAGVEALVLSCFTHRDRGN